MKDISSQQVREHLKRLNPWWESARMDDEIQNLRPRAFFGPVRDLLLESSLHRAIVLLGPRRVGKTILIRHLIGNLLSRGIDAKSIAYIEMDHPLLHGQSLEMIVQHVESISPDTAGLRFLFLDEIQSLKDWEKHLKPLVDYRRDLRIMVSGSAAAALKRKSTESGAGRFTDFLLPPLTFPEYLELREEQAAIHQVQPGHYLLHDIGRLNEQFIDYVNFGGYPELALSTIIRSDPERFVKSDIIDKVLLRDLPQLYGVSDIQELNSLFSLLAFNTAEEISYERLSQRSGVSKLTMQKYIEYLEAAFLVKRVFRVDQDGRRYKRDRNFKVYLTNSAMYTGLFGNTLPHQGEFGHLAETALFAQRFHESVHLNYARWGNQDCEVDLVESSRFLKPIGALEIKWSNNYVSHPKNLKGLVKFVHNNKLQLAWASTRSKFGSGTIGDATILQWPASVLAFHYGSIAVNGHLNDSVPRIENMPGFPSTDD
ncbi:MAG: ATP-binding protein [Gammaproteobacteria bacterium]|nr:ATP-binding protein [Gammaproteobacteria bacterium]